MNSNSFLIKGWTITLVVVALLLNRNKYHVFIAFIPLIIFVIWIHIIYCRKGCIENYIIRLLRID